jgi:hypothetical protein
LNLQEILKSTPLFEKQTIRKKVIIVMMKNENKESERARKKLGKW